MVLHVAVKSADGSVPSFVALWEPSDEPHRGVVGALVLPAAFRAAVFHLYEARNTHVSVSRIQEPSGREETMSLTTEPAGTSTRLPGFG